MIRFVFWKAVLKCAGQAEKCKRKRLAQKGKQKVILIPPERSNDSLK